MPEWLEELIPHLKGVFSKVSTKLLLKFILKLIF